MDVSTGKNSKGLKVDCSLSRAQAESKEAFCARNKSPIIASRSSLLEKSRPCWLLVDRNQTGGTISKSKPEATDARHNMDGQNSANIATTES